MLTSWANCTKKLEVNQKGSHSLTFCDVQIRCQKLYWRVWSMFLICHCVSRHSSYSFSFFLGSNIVAIHILHKLVHSARLFMKMASWGFMFYYLIFPESLVVCPEETECGVLCSSGAKFAVGRSTSQEEAVGAATGARMEIPSSL